MQVSGIKISFINSMVFITKSSSISAWLWLGLALSFLMVQQKRSGIKGIKSRVHAISQMLSYGLFHKTTAALGPNEPPDKVLDPPAFARLPARPLKFGPLCTGGRKSEVGILA